MVTYTRTVWPQGVMDIDKPSQRKRLFSKLPITLLHIR